MSDIQPTLDLIDGALDDYLSADAMRWTPDEGERVESVADRGVLTAERLRRARAQLREHAASPTLVFTPTTRVWMNGEEISHMISGVTVEREEGRRTRIGFNGGDPEVRDNVRVEVEQGGVTYMIDETRAIRETPLQRLSTDPLRRLASQARPGGYWTHEPATAEDWIAANPTVGERIEPAAIADWAESQGLQLEPWQRSMLEAVYAPRVPEPPSSDEVMDNVRRFQRLIDEQPRFIANPATAHRARVASHDLNIIASDLVPEGQVYVYNPPRLEDISFEPSPMRWDEDVYRFRVNLRLAGQQLQDGMRAVGRAFMPIAEAIAETARKLAPVIDALKAERRVRMRYLHSSYRQRQLARRRRNR